MSEAGTTTAAAAAPVTFGADPFFAKLDPEIQSAFKNKGWDTKSAAEAAVEAMKSYHAAEKHIGIPADQVLRFPKDANDAENWKVLNRRLGVPEKAEEYDFSKIKFSDGEAPEPEFEAAMRKAFYETNIPKEKAAELYSQLAKFAEQTVAEAETAKQAAMAAGKAAILKSWGANNSTNAFIALQGAKALGLDESMVDAVADVVGYEKTLQSLLAIGQKLGEDKFVMNQNTQTPGVLTVEQAEARLKELKRDAGWVQKVNSGDVKANDEFNALTRIMTGGG